MAFIACCARCASCAGRRFDVFGYDRVRRVERELVVEYRRLVFTALDDLSAENYARAVELARLPDMIRGYDEVKLANVERFWDKVRALGISPYAKASLTICPPLRTLAESMMSEASGWLILQPCSRSAYMAQDVK